MTERASERETLRLLVGEILLCDSFVVLCSLQIDTMLSFPLLKIANFQIRVRFPVTITTERQCAMGKPAVIVTVCMKNFFVMWQQLSQWFLTASRTQFGSLSSAFPLISHPNLTEIR